MGIPRFFKWIVDSFPDTIIRKSISSPQPFKNSSLYIDANGIIHNSVKDVYFTKRFAPQLQNIDKQTQVFQKITEYIKTLTDFVKPEKVYVAIDGTAPIAKQAQQRQRRYKSAAEKSEEDFNKFDTNSITPGTKFLKDLTLYINKNLKCVFSPPTEPGEGEHKLMKTIRENPDETHTHIVYGLDADLFMLTLATRKNVFLLREDMFSGKFNQYFHIVDINMIAENMYQKFGKNKTKKQFINDFIFSCFFVGNDFLHHLPGFWDLENSVQFMLNLDSPVVVNFLNPSTVNLQNLKNFIFMIAEKEKEMLVALTKTQRFPNVLLNSCVDKELNIEKYRKLYYEKAKVLDTATAIDTFCRRYIQGLCWVNWYYHKGVKNWRWLFPYHYSPLAIDVYNFLEKNPDIKPMHHILSPPLTEKQQLMCVIPPKSLRVLPEDLRGFYKHPELLRYYPEEFEKDLSGKRQEWEAVALLPFIDLKVLLKVMEKS